MTAHHFFARSVDEDVVRITGEEARHASRVLRIRPGEEITVSNGAGTVVRARCTGAERDLLIASVVSRAFVEREPPAVVVYPAIAKGGKLDTIVQKLTEVGVDEIRPWFSARSIVRWDAARARAHTDRMHAIAWEAAKQSRRAWLPEVAEPSPLADLPELTFVFEVDAPRRLSEVVPAVAPDRVGLVIGPEGGIDPAELREMEESGARAVSMGPQVLRAETASLVGAALVLSHFQRLG